MMSKKNMGSWDRAGRMLLGIGLLLAVVLVEAISDSVLLTILVGGFALINIGSATAAWCPLYTAVGLSTRQAVSPTENSEPQSVDRARPEERD